MATVFSGGDRGQWRIGRIECVTGEGLPLAAFLDIGGDVANPAWMLRGVASHVRYTTRPEKSSLEAVQAPLGRPAATRASLIPIRKTDAWWALTQDERRTIYERSEHLPIGMEYLPAVARKLYHSRDLGESFDFLTWFEFAPEHEAAFDQMLARLRASEEWSHVDREIDIRLTRV